MPDDGLQLAARGLVFGLPAALEQHRSRRFVRFCVTPLTRTVGGEISGVRRFPVRSRLALAASVSSGTMQIGMCWDASGTGDGR
jgi:hypothetical protein